MTEIWRGGSLTAGQTGGWHIWSRGYAVGPDGICRTDAEIGHHLLANRDRLHATAPALNGCFSAVLTNGVAATIITDRFGTVPVYLGSDHTGGLSVADSPWPMIGRLPQAPWIQSNALIDMLHTGYVTGTATMIAGIETAPPAAIIRIEGKSVRKERYWSFGYRPESMTESEAIDELVEVLQSVIRRSRLVLEKMHARPLLTLSGGLDSRLLAGLFAGSGKPAPAGISYGSNDDPEVIVAQEIAAALHMHTRAVPVDKSYLNNAFFAQSVEEVGITTRLTCGIGARHLTTVPGDMLVPGHTGDFISGGHLPPQAALVRNRAQLQRFLDIRHFRYPLSQRILRRVLAPDPGLRFDSLERTTANFDMAEDMFGLIDRWNVENRQRRLILTELRAYERKAPWVLPFYDYELVDFFARIPHALRLGQNLYVRTALDRIFTGDAAALATIRRVGKPLSVDLSTARRMRSVARIPQALATPALAVLPALRALNARLRRTGPATSGPDPLCHWYRTDPEVRAFLDARLRAITLAEIDADGLLELAGRADTPQEFFQRLTVSAITAQEIVDQAASAWHAAQSGHFSEQSKSGHRQNKFVQ